MNFTKLIKSKLIGGKAKNVFDCILDIYTLIFIAVKKFGICNIVLF